MKKSKVVSIILIIALSLTMAVGMSACGSGGTDDQGGDTNPPSGTNETPGDNSSDEVFTFKFNSTDPPTQGSSQGLVKWADALEQATNGRIKIEFFWSSTLSPAVDAYTSLLTGGSDMMFSTIGNFSGQFPLTEAAMVPMRGENNCIVRGLALQDVYDENAEMQKEWDQVKILGFIGNECYNVISSTTDPSIYDNWKKAKVRVSGTILSRWTEKIGAEPVNITTNEVYEAYNKHIVDYVLWNWSSTTAFGLMEDTKYACTDQFGYSVLFIAMNKDKYASLPDDLKAIFDEYSGHYIVETVMTTWLENGVIAIGDMAEAGVQFTSADAKLKDAWTKASDELKSEYSEELKAKGLDPDAFYTEFDKNIKKYNEEYPGNTYEIWLSRK